MRATKRIVESLQRFVQSRVRLARAARHAPHRRQAVPPDDVGLDRAVASIAQEPDLLENYYLFGHRAVAVFVEHYNHCRRHERPDNLTPADVSLGRDQTILNIEREIKRKTIEQRRKQHLGSAA